MDFYLFTTIFFDIWLVVSIEVLLASASVIRESKYNLDKLSTVELLLIYSCFKTMLWNTNIRVKKAHFH